MTNIKVFYKGGLNEKQDSIIKQALDQAGYSLIGSGFNFKEQERDLEFEYVLNSDE